MDIQPSSPAPDIRFSGTSAATVPWARRRQAGDGGELADRRLHIPETCLGQQAHWRRRTSEAGGCRAGMLKAHGPAPERASRWPSPEIGAYLATCRAEGCSPTCAVAGRAIAARRDLTWWRDPGPVHCRHAGPAATATWRQIGRTVSGCPTTRTLFRPAGAPAA